MSKKFLAKLLIFCMIFTMLPVSAFGAETKAAETHVYTIGADVAPTSVAVGGTATITLGAYTVDNDTKTTHEITKLGATPSVTWSVKTGSTGAVTVDGNTVTATKAGDVTLAGTVTGVNVPTGTTAVVKEVTLTVTPANNKITIGGELVDFCVSDTVTLTATITENAVVIPNQQVTWKSSDETVVTVNAAGVVSAQSIGTAVITATYTADGQTYTGDVKIEVKARDYQINVEATAMTMQLGDKAAVSATVKPSDGVDLSWTSSDPTVISVEADNSLLAKKAGTAVVTVTATRNGVVVAKESINVTVSEKETGVVVTLNGNGGTTPGTVAGTTKATTTVNADKDGYLTTLPTFTREGYKFVGWAKTKDVTKADVDAKTKFTEATEIFAIWEQLNEVTGVTVNPETTKVNVGKDVTLTADVKVVGNPEDKAVIWTSSDDKIAKVDTNGKVTGVAVGKVMITATVAGKTASAEVEVVAADKELFTVTFVSDGKTVSTVQVEKGDTVVAPQLDGKKGYKFEGWFNGETQLDEKTTITTNTTFTAKWVEKMFTITFDPQNGGLVSEQKVQEGKKASKIADPTKVGYTFVGWVDASGALFDFDSTINGNITLTAKWQEKYVTIKLYANDPDAFFFDNSQTFEIKVAYGAALTDYPVPERPGYLFGGWMDKVVDGKIITSDTKFIADTTLYAKWNAAPKEGTETVAVSDTVAKTEGTPANETEQKNMDAAKAAAENLEVIETTNLKTAVDELVAGKGYDKETGKFEIGNQKEDVRAKVEAFAELDSAAEPNFYVIPTTQITIKPSAKEFAETRLTFDVKPVAVVKIAAKGLTEEQVKSLNDKNSVYVNTYNVTIAPGEPVYVALPVGSAFAQKLSEAVKAAKMPAVLHHGIQTRITSRNIGEDYVVFANKYGFSEFVVDLGSETKCAIGENVYDSLTEAIAAIVDGDTVVVNIKENATVTINKEGTFKFVKGDYVADGVKLTVNAGSGLKINPDSNASNDGFTTYTITKVQSNNNYPAGGGGGGGSSSNVSVATNVTGGKVTVSPSRPVRGQTVTLTAKPADGYKLDTLTVTDSKGNVIELTKIDDNKYTFTMPAGKITVTPAFVKVDGADKKDEDKPGTNVSKRFSDVASDAWYAEYINYVAENGLMNGYENGTFGPNDKTTRAQIVTVLYRMEGEPAVQNSNSFKDVSAGGQYYSSAVAWAARNNIVNGYEDGRFGPNDNVTREQIAAILFRYAEYKGYDTTLAGNIASFNDAAKVSAWATKAIGWAVGEGLMNGDNGALRPQGNATRAEIAALLMRFSENIAK